MSMPVTVGMIRGIIPITDIVSPTITEVGTVLGIMVGTTRGTTVGMIRGIIPVGTDTDIIPTTADIGVGTDNRTIVTTDTTEEVIIIINLDTATVVKVTL